VALLDGHFEHPALYAPTVPDIRAMRFKQARIVTKHLPKLQPAAGLFGSFGLSG
jgi:hypothetical protein